MVNCKKIRITSLQPGTFTNISLNNLYNNKLTANARLLLFAILGDSNNFDISQTLYCQRFNWDKKQFARAIVNLEENGYIKRTPISQDKYIIGRKKSGSNKILYYYVISEFGDLNKEILDVA
jgi:DNA-binding MarR family transcriptional regulator